MSELLRDSILFLVAFMVYTSLPHLSSLISGQKDIIPDSKVHGANMGLICGQQDPGGPMLAPWTFLSGMKNAA